MALSLGQQLVNGNGAGGGEGTTTEKNVTSTPTLNNPGLGLNGQWEQHPIYLALSSRLSATENTLASLSSQVTHLQDLIQKALPTQSLQSQNQQQQTGAPVRPAEPTRTGSDGSSGDSVAALTQQISALSTSVAQLQRLQSQNNLSRQHSNRDRERAPGNGTGPGNSTSTSTANPLIAPPILSLSSVPSNIYNTGPLTAPHPATTSPFTPRQPHHIFTRPPVSRSVSQSTTSHQLQSDQDKTWAPPLRTPGTGMINPISPGPWPSAIPTTPSNTISNGGPMNTGLMTPSVMGPGTNGPSAPGAGIVVTKWDHLNLKPELVRSIQKYG